MMKLYVVVGGLNSSNNPMIFGIFSTREEASKCKQFYSPSSPIPIGRFNKEVRISEYPLQDKFYIPGDN